MLYIIKLSVDFHLHSVMHLAHCASFLAKCCASFVLLKHAYWDPQKTYLNLVKLHISLNTIVNDV